MVGSLEGVRVLELARYQAGPRGGMIMSDLGAEVIKIEKLDGEETRRSRANRSHRQTMVERPRRRKMRLT